MYQTILVPTDFSEPAELAWKHAVELAKVHGSKLVLVYVVEPLLSHYGVVGLIPGVKEMEEEHDTQSRLKLKELIAETREGGMEVACHVLKGKPWQVVVDEAKKAGADLVVMGTHGRTGIGHESIGSTAERVVQHAPCPVMVVRPNGD